MSTRTGPSVLLTMGLLGFVLCLQVRPTDSYNLRQKVKRVRSVVDAEMGFIENEEGTPRTTYLFVSRTEPNSNNSANGTTLQRRTMNHRNTNGRTVRNGKVLGMVTAEAISKAYPFNCVTKEVLSSSRAKRAMVGIRQIWVHRSVRRTGVATALVDAVRRSFVFGMTVPIGMLAFSSPSESGSVFAQGYCRQEQNTTPDTSPTGSSLASSLSLGVPSQVLVYDLVFGNTSATTENDSDGDGSFDKTYKEQE